jgi:tetrapyrrole methylase family protein/MazG family protein
MAEHMERLIKIVEKLRAPDGCPWDREQTHSSLLPGLLDESYEFFEAVDENNSGMMKEELGDILLQVVLHAQIAGENKLFNIEDVACGIADKIVHRHPHVFGGASVSSTAEVLTNWEKIKRTEKKDSRKYVTDGVPANLPALLRADKIQSRAARVGFDWKDIGPVMDKVEEEFREFREAVEKGDHDNAEEELGDILFALTNVARHKKISAEDALRRTINKFVKRFNYIEDQYSKAGKKLEDSTLEEMDVFWEQSKKIVG